MESSTPSSSPIDDAKHPLQPPSYTPLPKKSHGGRKKNTSKKNALRMKKRTDAESRLHFLSGNFHPVPFSPGKTLDFFAREKLFRALGLWDFVHLELDREVRSDLLVHLIAYYDSTNHCSFVHGTRISLKRIDLARALRLPTKKEKANVFECADEDVGVLLEFISNYMPYGDDMCILPSEIMLATQFVKERAPQKVDWAALMWVLVEKELLDASKSGVFHCASHLQCLLKQQRPNLFEKKEDHVSEPVVEAQEEEALVAEAVLGMTDDNHNVAVAEEDAAYDDKNAGKVSSFEDFGNEVPDKEDKEDKELGLTLGVEGNLTDDLEEDKAAEVGQWPDEGENVGFEQCFRRCNSRIDKDIDFENLTKENEQVSQEMGYADDFSAKFSSIGMIASSDLLHAMATTSTTNIHFDQQMDSFNATSGEFLKMGSETDKDVLIHCRNGTLYSGNNSKRHAGAMSAAEVHFEQNRQKRICPAKPWSNLELSFDECLECMQASAERASLLYAEKNQTIANMNVQMQYLNHVLQEKDESIRSLRIMVEDQQHCKMVVRHYEHELTLMTQMLFGYKKALKETRSSFAEFRKKCSHDEEALYKDVPGTGGLVLSMREFEKHQLEKREEERQKLLVSFDNLDKVLMKFNECEGHIVIHNRKLVNLAGEVKQLKERFVKSNFPSI